MVAFRHKRKKTEKKRDRISYLTIVVFIFAILIVIRLSDIQIFQHTFYTALAEGQHFLSEKLMPKRGEIFVHDRFNSQDLYPVAINRDYTLVYAVPKNVQNPEDTAKKLAEVLELDENELLPRLTKTNDLYEPIKHQVNDDKIKELEKLNLAGIEFQKETFRYYPEKNITSHILGFVGIADDKQVGQYGIEGYWENALAGQQGYLQAEKDATGRWISIGTRMLEEAKDGDSLVLTIDRNIQFEACKSLGEAVQKHGADGGSLIVMNPKTGAVLAMCGYPDFDPNNYGEVKDINTFINPATFYIYEPGSVFKAITMAAALDMGKVNPDTTYNDEGSVQIGKYTIKNSDGKAHGVNTMTQVLEQSLNTGAIFAARQIGPENFEKYVKRFGFGEKTSIELNSEAEGDISTLAQHKEIYMATASFGQGISVTPLQLVTAFGVIANGGKLVEPYIIDEIIKNNGTKVKTEPKIIREAISQKTATTLAAMLVNVVQNGHGKKAGVAGYFVAGKTGTAQIPKKDGPGYESDLTIGSFCGFATVSDPKFVMCVKIDKPRDVQWAESSAAPLFGDLAKFMLNYYGVPPEEDIE